MESLHPGPLGLHLSLPLQIKVPEFIKGYFSEAMLLKISLQTTLHFQNLKKLKTRNS